MMRFFKTMIATVMACVVIVIVLQYASVIFSGATLIPMGNSVLGDYLAVDSIPTDIISIGFVLLTGIYVYTLCRQRWRGRAKTDPREAIRGGKSNDLIEPK